MFPGDQEVVSTKDLVRELKEDIQNLCYQALKYDRVGSNVHLSFLCLFGVNKIYTKTQIDAL